MIENSASASKAGRPLIFASSRSGYWRVLANELAAAERRTQTSSASAANTDQDEE